MTMTNPAVDASELAALREKPTGLKPVLAVIPDHCYERSRARGLFLMGRDIAFYVAALVGLTMTDKVYLLVPLWILASLSVSGLFILGHDAAHGALFDSKKLNMVVARIAMLPSLHATEQWVFGHNRVHHGHTLRQGMDFVWHPTTLSEYAEYSKFERARHRLEWSMLGAGAYYSRAVWLNKMVLFTPPKRWAKEMNRDRLFVGLYALTFLVGTLAFAGFGGLWLFAKLLVIPFLGFCQIIGWAVYVHHIAPDIRWWGRREWNRYRGQVEGTTVLWGPPGWEIFFHWIMVHLPHHVDMRIPCYKLPDAARAIKAAMPDDVVERPIRLKDYLHSTKNCKLHNFETGVWSKYPS